uniref:Uncharacterized protein n=1 Tax=Setaria italica TaxID=4555 RepID=K4AHW9_SETIT
MVTLNEQGDRYKGTVNLVKFCIYECILQIVQVYSYHLYCLVVSCTSARKVQSSHV